STLMQFTCTLNDVEVPTLTLPCSSVRKLRSNLTTDSAPTSTDDPSISRLATNPDLVSSASPGKTVAESATSLPFTHTPPLLCTMAEAGPAASSDGGKTASITQPRK